MKLAIILILTTCLTIAFALKEHKHNHDHDGIPKETMDEVIDQLSDDCSTHFDVIKEIAEENKDDKKCIATVESIVEKVDAAKTESTSVVEELRVLTKENNLTVEKWDEEISKYVKVISNLHYDVHSLGQDLRAQLIEEIEREFSELKQHIQEIKENGKALIKKKKVHNNP